MRYFVTSNDDSVKTGWEGRLRDHGYDVVDDYDSDAVIITLGGDGSILYVARRYEDSTILPVRTGNSKGFKTVSDEDRLLATLEQLETEDGEYSVTEYGKLAAYHDGVQLRGGFAALNEINLHHASPAMATIFALRISDRDFTHEFERVTGDGVVVATAFGSTAYYHSITGGWFTDGIGVAFNNVHTPATAPEQVVVSTEASIELEVVESKRVSRAVLTRDNAEQMYELSVGEQVTIRQSDESIELVNPAVSGTKRA